jgi:hypothetical protein
VIGIELQGLDEVIESIKGISTSIDRESVFADVAEDFAGKLKDATPPGYNRKLPDSVIFTATEDGAEVGYEEGVVTAGDSSIDAKRARFAPGGSVLAGRPRGRRRVWARPSELESVLQETIDKHAASAASVLADRFIEEVNRGIA